MKNTRGILGLLLIGAFFAYSPLQAQGIQEPESKHYNEGTILFDRGLYERAANEFEQFLTLNEDHELRPAAKYYLARSRARADSANKSTFYEEFITNYPHSDFSSELLFELGKNAEEQELYSQARDYYSRALKLGLNDKQSARAYYWMAEAEAENGNNQQAREYYLTLADEYPRSEWAPKALYARGRLYLSENRYDASTEAFEILKDRYPNNEMTRRIGTALGESYYQQERYQEAIEAFRNAMPHLEGEMRSKAVYLTAESYNYLGNFDEASDYYLQYINLNKGTDQVRVAHYGLGWVYHKQEIYHWAADEFGKAAKGDDEIARKALYYKAVNEKLGSRYSEAIETFRTFGERFKEGLWIEEAYYEWAITAYEMSRYSEAIEVLLPLVRSDENLDWAGKVYTLLGESYFANKEYTRSIQAFEAAEEVTDIDPTVKQQAQFQKAWVQYSNQAYQEAQKIFESLHRKAPNTDFGSEALFWSADAYYHMDHFGPASKQFNQFIQRYPDHELVGAANYALGWSRFKMGDFQGAIEPFVTFKEEYEPPEVALYPYDTDTQLRIGDAYYAIGDYDKAISSYKEAIGAEPGGDYAMFQIANSYYRAEQTYDAVTTFRKFLRIYPYSNLREQAQYNIGYIYLNTGNYSQAVEEFQTVINKYPNTSWAARAQYNIGDTYYNAGDYEKAIAAYKKVMEKYPDSEYIIEAVNGIQYAQMSSSGADSSTAVLEEFLAENPQTSTADRLRYRQADNYMQSGDYQGAIEEFKQYIRITNNEDLLPDAHYNLANAYEETGRINEAEEAYQTVVSKFPDSDRAAPSLAALGKIAFDKENYQQSFDYFNELADKSRQYQQKAYIGMGNAQLAMNNPDEASEYYEAALDQDENYDAANVGLAKVAISNGNYQKAEELLTTVAESNSREVGAEAQYLLGVTKYEQGQYQEATQEFSNVSVLFEAYGEWVAKALLEQGKAYIQLGQSSEARSVLSTLVEEYPDAPEAAEARRLLN